MERTELIKLLGSDFGHLLGDQLMALTIFGEARGETRDGKIAVGSVILERVEHRKWDGETIKEVCLMPYQFSCFLPNDPNYPRLKRIAKEWDASLLGSMSLYHCYAIARGLIDGTIPRDPIIKAEHATQYLTVDCEAAWEKKMRKVMTLGRHDFYKDA